jgi:BirA family transcriptional regulator, biotin operon repressor / biotin---[acetyl-CoA-carboxylase] ligase
VIDSTNRYLIDEALSGAADGLVAVADYQTAGRGRLGRRWEAPSQANLLCSVLLRPDLGSTQLHLATAVVALAASDACVELFGIEPALKWPNDLLVVDRKLAGILAESTRDAVVVGLGLNVRWPESPPSAGAQEHASGLSNDRPGGITSLWLERDRRTEAEAFEPLVVLAAVLENLEWRLAGLGGGPEGRRAQADEYRRRCATVGRRVRVSLGRETGENTGENTGEKTIDGEAIGITPEGHLEVESGGRVVEISAGDVFHVG